MAEIEDPELKELQGSIGCGLTVVMLLIVIMLVCGLWPISDKLDKIEKQCTTQGQNK